MEDDRKDMIYKTGSTISFIIAFIGFVAGVVYIKSFGIFLFLFVALFLWIGILCKDIADTPEEPIKRPTRTSTRNTGSYIVYITHKSKVYHNNIHCHLIKKSWDMISQEEAKRRKLRPCEFCYPQKLNK